MLANAPTGAPAATAHHVAVVAAGAITTAPGRSVTWSKLLRSCECAVYWQYLDGCEK